LLFEEGFHDNNAMKSLLRTLNFFLQFATVGLALAFVTLHLAPDLVEKIRDHRSAAVTSNATEPTTDTSATPGLTPTKIMPTSSSAVPDNGPVSYRDAVAHAAPAVVNIYANKTVTGRFTTDQLMIQRLFGGQTINPTYKQRRQSLGSGVIFTADGYVLTNNHVISRADEIQVLLYDNRVAQARVVGTDADTDLAVLKIEAANLPTIAIANNMPVNVGDVALAIGNPFGFGKTVTLGIVSAIGRQLNLSAYEDFIQTDAAINEGNSGGALVNAYGELIGINTAMYRQNPAAEGIGFAIPVATAKQVLDQIITHGQVIRGWLGAEYSDVPVAANSGLPAAARGVIMLEVYGQGPADLAGLQPGDVLLKLDNQDIGGQGELRHREAKLAPGTKVMIAGLRAGVPFTVETTLIQRPVFRGSEVGG